VTTLTVDEAAATYERAMRNPRPAQPGDICATCKTFIAPPHTECIPCNRGPGLIDSLVPITYSEHGGQVHHALRSYKDGGPAEQAYATPRLAGILWKFLARHEQCVASAAGSGGFDLVTTVPSSSPAREERSSLRMLAGWCQPVQGRLETLLRPTGQGGGRAFLPDRYEGTTSVDGQDVLLLDDTWTAGGHAQSAAWALRQAGARRVGMVVIGRHLRPDWEVSPGRTCADIYADLPRAFDWDTCAVCAAEL